MLNGPSAGHTSKCFSPKTSGINKIENLDGMLNNKISLNR